MVTQAIVIGTVLLMWCGGVCNGSNSNSDYCTDAKHDPRGGWQYLRPIYGQKVKVTGSEFNSTFTVGICTDVLSDNANMSGQYAGVAEFTADQDVIVVGRYNESELMKGSHWILLKYMDGDAYTNDVCGNTNRHAAIMIVCDHNIQKLDKAQIIDENLGRNRDCYHLFEIEHCLACISDGCDAFFHSYSPGTIIIIGLFSLVSLYLVFGWLYTRCVLKKTGWEQLPNAQFWKEIGHLQADGCVMVCRCGTRLEDDYNLIGGDSHSVLPQSTSLLSDDENMLPT